MEEIINRFVRGLHRLNKGIDMFIPILYLFFRAYLCVLAGELYIKELGYEPTLFKIFCLIYLGYPLYRTYFYKLFSNRIWREE